ncbi:transposase family protein [uncultured Halopseudomonas sp.]|uniref:integrase catalytic domain-containing protein n=1 Tax=uncultured Halopseudomonas sp. TaxID=2901193 RepID=UPI0030EE4CC6|tara:strand:+ start:10320 stop:12092 length:1773 start_codon:yes stop_codon:yes gene_type:complete
MSAVITERLVAVAQAVRAAGHGGKSAIYANACQELGLSRATLHRKLKDLTVTNKTRKRRTDAGQSDLTRDEALMISGVLMETLRNSGKRLYSITDAVQGLRANNLIRAERVNRATGEVAPLSDSAIHRALRAYSVHPDQLLAPTPHTELASLHPNHVWQIDASLCVLYYLKPQARSTNGLHVMAHDEFYKNKPKNLQRIMADRVWSYEITDHTSGWIYVEYVMGAESGENLCNVLINALQERGGADILHGIPAILFMDPGSANTSTMALNLCKSLGIQAIAHAPGNARATGQVENARNIIERKFESGLKFRPVADLAELNALAAQWRAVFNATTVHRRHGKNRSAMWLTITQDQLIKAPTVAVCRELAVAQPQERKVTPKLRINFQGEEYDVSRVPGVMVAEKVLVTRNPWRDDAAQVVTVNADGREVFNVVPRVVKDEFGFAENAAIIGTSYNAPADTVAQKDRQAIEQLMTGTTTPGEAEAQRKAKALPLGGKYNPYKATEEADLPTFMPRRGTDHELAGPIVELPPMTLFAAAKRLMNQFPEWNKEHFSALKASFPDGVREDELEAAAERVRATMARPKLSVVGGNQ